MHVATQVASIFAKGYCEIHIHCAPYRKKSWNVMIKVVMVFELVRIHYIDGCVCVFVNVLFVCFGVVAMDTSKIISSYQ